jgi:hypothetical protein
MDCGLSFEAAGNAPVARDKIVKESPLADTSTTGYCMLDVAAAAIRAEGGRARCEAAGSTTTVYITLPPTAGKAALPPKATAPVTIILVFQIDMDPLIKAFMKTSLVSSSFQVDTFQVDNRYRMHPMNPTKSRHSKKKGLSRIENTTDASC